MSGANNFSLILKPPQASAVRPEPFPPPYLCSKSTGAVTSCTRQYFLGNATRKAKAPRFTRGLL